MTYLATSSLPGLSIFSTPSLLPVAGKRKYSRKRVYVAIAVAYSVWVSFAITARNSSSRLDWVVSSSLSLHILIRPCESPVASVWRLETKKQKINRGISTLMVVFHSMEALGTGCNFSQTSQWPLYLTSQTSYIVSRAFRRPHTGYFYFPRFSLIMCFPSLVCRWLISHKFSRAQNLWNMRYHSKTCLYRAPLKFSLHRTPTKTTK